MAFTQGWTLLDTQGRSLKATAYYSYSCIVLPGQFLRVSSIVFPDLSCLIQTTLIISKVFEIHAAVPGQFFTRITSIELFPVGHIRSIYHIKGGIFWHCCMGFLNLVCLMQEKKPLLSTTKGNQRENHRKTMGNQRKPKGNQRTTKGFFQGCDDFRYRDIEYLDFT